VNNRTEKKCACHSDDAYECWRSRYNIDVDEPGYGIEADGGPCHCVCHDRREEDYDPAEFL
jgi:hypothetical protein